jgi:hypothetical protein
LGIYAVKTDKSGTYRRVYTFSSFGSASDYFLGVSDSLGALTLPITLINFNGRYWGKYVQLNWQTTQEVNSHKFDVERSLNGSLFVKIGTVAAKGNSNVTSNYRFVDNDLPFNAPQQVLFYRLKSIDKDGVYAYSDVLALDAAQNESVGIFPNPNNGTFRFTTREVNRKLSVLITDAAGRKIYENNFYNTSSPLVRIPPIKGIYFFRAEGDKEIFTKKLVVE